MPKSSSKDKPAKAIGNPTPFEAIVIAYYLARFDKLAIEKLGFKNFRQCFDQLGEKLQVPPNTLKNRRDDFDPLFGYRAGWHQNKLGGKLAKVADSFECTEDEDLHELATGILSGEKFLQDDVWKELKSSFIGPATKKEKKACYICSKRNHWKESRTSF